MACMASEKNTGLPLPPHQQKRCSLPGPSGSLNVLAATHQQQRRLSERGLIIYKPSKPDIDLIRDFTQKRSSISSPSGSGSTNHPETGSLPSQPPLKSTSDGSKVTSEAGGPSTSSSSCRQVKMRMGTDSVDTYYELETIGPSPPPEPGAPELLPNPRFDANRRFSDSAAMFHPPIISITGSESSGIICTTGDLVSLKCLNSSAQEIRYSQGSLVAGQPGSGQVNLSQQTGTNPEVSGNRSRSFDGGSSRGYGSSWLRRRHLPISVKLPLVPPGSPSTLVNSPGSSGSPSTSKDLGEGQGSVFELPPPLPPPPTLSREVKKPPLLPKISISDEKGEPMMMEPQPPPSPAPLLTITTDNEGESEIIEIPSPPVASPETSPKNSPEEPRGAKQGPSGGGGGGGATRGAASKVAWDKNGYMLDAAALGTAIERHLKSGDLSKRRATISTLYEAPPDSVQSQVTARARSASAYNVTPIFPGSGGEPLPAFPGSSSTGAHTIPSATTSSRQKFFLESEGTRSSPNRRKGSLQSVVLSGPDPANPRSWDCVYPTNLPPLLPGAPNVRRASCIESIQFAIPSTADEREEEELEKEDEEEEGEEHKFVQNESDPSKKPLLNRRKSSAASTSGSGGGSGTNLSKASAVLSSAAAAVFRLNRRESQGRDSLGGGGGGSRKGSTTSNQGGDDGGGGGGGGGGRGRGRGAQPPFIGFTICNVIRDFFVNSFKP